MFFFSKNFSLIYLCTFICDSLFFGFFLSFFSFTFFLPNFPPSFLRFFFVFFVFFRFFFLFHLEIYIGDLFRAFLLEIRRGWINHTFQIDLTSPEWDREREAQKKRNETCKTKKKKNDIKQTGRKERSMRKIGDWKSISITNLTWTVKKNLQEKKTTKWKTRLMNDCVRKKNYISNSTTTKKNCKMNEKSKQRQQQQKKW